MLVSLHLNEFQGKLNHDAVEDAHDFIGVVGYGEGFAPCACFGNTEGVLSENVRSDVIFGADDEGGENARIGVDLLNCGRTVAHGSCFTPLRNWVDGMPKTKATLLLVCHAFWAWQSQGG